MTQRDADQLVEELSKHFDGRAEWEEVSPGRFRFAVVSSRFKNIGHLTRQDQAWEFVDKIFDRERKFDISLLLTFAPDDVELAPQP